MRSIAIATTVVCFLGISSAPAATIHVPSDQPTIQAGINAASNGDTVLVAPGTYLGNILVQDKEVNIISEGGASATSLVFTSEQVPKIRLLHGSGSFSGFSLVGQTLNNKLIFVQGGTFTISENVFRDVHSNAEIIWGESGTGELHLDVRRNVFSNARGDNAMLVFIGSGDVKIVNNTIDAANRAMAVYVSNSIVRNNIITHSTQYAIVFGSAIVSEDYNCFWANARIRDENGGLGDYDLQVDPQYIDQAGSNFNLKPTSPCINTGDPDPSYNDSDGTRDDMGALPYTNILPLAYNISFDGEAALHIVSHAPTLHWSFYDPGHSQVGFEIQVGTDIDWSVAEKWSTGSVLLSDTSIVYGGTPLIDGETYFARLRLYNGNTWGGWSYWSFRMNSSPSVPIAFRPKSGGSVGASLVTLTVQNSTDAEFDTLTYEFAIYADPGATSIVASQTGVKQQSDLTDSHPFLGLTLGSEYWWRARSYDGREFSEWSTVQAFLTRAAAVVHVPTDETTIQSGINAASNGDTVLVAPGTYTENIDFKGKSLCLIASGGPSATLLQPASSSADLVRIATGEPLGTLMTGFTMRGGSVPHVILISNYADPTISHCTFRGYTSSDVVIYCGTSHALITRNFFYGNSGISCVGIYSGFAQVVSNTFDGNNRGFFSITGQGEARNNIVTNSSNYGIFGVFTASEYNDVWSNNPNYDGGSTAGTGSISTDPLYLNRTNHYFNLTSASPCINTGDPDPSYNDPDGTRNDIGAISYSPPRIPKQLLVPSHYATIQTAVDSSIVGDTIVLADGTYKGPGNRDIQVLNKDLVIVSEHGASSTTIDCEGSAYPNCHFAFLIQSAAGKQPLVQGITFTHGTAQGGDYGGAIRFGGGSPVVRSCIFRDNGPCTDAIAIDMPGGTIDSCGFYANSSGGNSGVVHSWGAISISNSVFEGNLGLSAELDGPFTITNCAFRSNTSVGWSVLRSSGVSTLLNCQFSKNVSTRTDYAGATVFVPEGHLRLVGCSFVDNSVANGRGTAINCLGTATASIEKTIIAFGKGGSAVGSDSSSAISLSCSNLYGNQLGDWVGPIASYFGKSGNVALNPLFCDTAISDHRVKNSSPCLPANNSCGAQIGAFGQGCLNAAPVITSKETANVNEDAPFTYHATATDPDGPSLIWSYLDKPSWLTNNADSIYGVPHYPVHDTSFVVIASDGFLADTMKVTVTVHQISPEARVLRVDLDTLNLHVVNHMPRLDWSYFDPTAQAPQAQFELGVGTDSNWTYSEMWNPAPFTGPQDYVTYSGAPLVDAQTYYWRVRVYNGSKWSPWEQSRFRMNSVPSAPALLRPLTDAAVGNSPTLVIQNSNDAEGDALRYDFYVWTDSTLTAADTFQFDVPSGSDTTGWAVPKVLREDTRHWWTVRAFDGYEHSSWSGSSFFWANGTQTPPAVPLLVSPDGTQGPVYTLLPTFGWSPCSDPDPFDTVSYKLELSLSGSFSLAFGKDSIPTASYQLTDSLAFGTHYYWRVTAKDRTGLQTRSLAREFWTWALGDLNGSHLCDLADLSSLVSYLTGAGYVINPKLVGDLNRSCFVDSADLATLVSYLTGGGAQFKPGCQGMGRNTAVGDRTSSDKTTRGTGAAVNSTGATH